MGHKIEHVRSMLQNKISKAIYFESGLFTLEILSRKTFEIEFYGINISSVKKVLLAVHYFIDNCLRAIIDYCSLGKTPVVADAWRLWLSVCLCPRSKKRPEL